MSETHKRIPPHLRQFVVEQDYDAYDAIDHSVWRFVLLQLHAQLEATAHPAYARGLAQTGIGLDRIPRLAEMDARLSEYGWGAVAVDGFIPPRAFQEFQALSILTIAVDIRTAEHLAYTPAPDIIHESAGHAPIIPDPAYARFLRRFGEVGARAFSSPEDRRVYHAIHHLSELKENPLTSQAELDRAQSELDSALASVTQRTEAALLSRLHWWTVEYGLVGTPSAYKLYGAGLLSSLGESHFCHEPKVRKLPLTADCIDFDYDITKPQPQLFVAESFEHLSEVLEEVAASLAQTVGGELALRRALESEETATVELEGGLQITGELSEALPEGFLRFSGRCALASDGKQLPGFAPQGGLVATLGRLADGSALWQLRADDLARFAGGDSLELSFQDGLSVRGRLEGVEVCAEGRLRGLALEAPHVQLGSRELWGSADGPLVVALGDQVRAAYAGPADPAYWPESDFPATRVPQRHCDPDRARLLALYRRASGGSEATQLCDELNNAYPDEWLLRWNLLEQIRRVGTHVELGRRLRDELLAIEQRRFRDIPVTTGLRYLDERYPAA